MSVSSSAVLAASDPQSSQTFALHGRFDFQEESAVSRC